MNATPQSIWFPGVTLADCNAISRDTMTEAVGIVFTEIGADFLRCTMPVTERLAESLASTAANLTFDFSKQAAVGQEINANHLRPAAFGSTVTGTARPFHIGARSQVWGIEIVDERQRLVCVSRITLAVIERAPRT